MPVHFLVVIALIAIVAVLSETWAAIWLLVACLVVYYIRQYHRLVVVPKRRAKAIEAASKQDSVPSETQKP